MACHMALDRVQWSSAIRQQPLTVDQWNIQGRCKELDQVTRFMTLNA